MNDDTNAAFFKMAVAWAGAAFGSLTLQDYVLWATLIYTLVQIYLLVRDKVLK